MPGKYLKRATQACTGKARFETQQEAERTAEYRYRAYQCAVCHAWHLTSRSGAARRPDDLEPEAPPERPKPLATLGDLDWTGLAAEPSAKKPKAAKPARPAKLPGPPAPTAKPLEQRILARCASGLRKDHRVILVIDETLLKSRPVLESLRAQIRTGALVVVAPVEGSAIVLELAKD